MDELIRSIEFCRAAGVDCPSCVHATAADVASVCGRIEQPALSNLFVQLYPADCCAPMGAAFMAAYAGVALKPVHPKKAA